MAGIGFLPAATFERFPAPALPLDAPMTATLSNRPDTRVRMPNSPHFLLFLICLFASAGQLAIDIYVPALPAMARYFVTSPQAIQSSVSGYMAAYALGQ